MQSKRQEHLPRELDLLWHAIILQREAETANCLEYKNYWHKSCTCFSWVLFFLYSMINSFKRTTERSLWGRCLRPGSLINDFSWVENNRRRRRRNRRFTTYEYTLFEISLLFVWETTWADGYTFRIQSTVLYTSRDWNSFAGDLHLLCHLFFLFWFKTP